MLVQRLEHGVETLSNDVYTRTHCDCGHALEPATEAGPNWGDWRCKHSRCWFRYCQDCGSHLDQYNECVAYREAQDKETA